MLDPRRATPQDIDQANAELRRRVAERMGVRGEDVDINAPTLIERDKSLSAREAAKTLNA